MEHSGWSHGAARLAARCRHTVATADRGWKATALGVGILAVVALIP